MRRTDCIDQSANSPQPRVRPGGEFFTSPTHPGQRRYEASRAYLHDGEAAAAVAQRFGYTTAALNSAVRDFRAGGQEFFLTVTPGPKSAPGKDAARARIIELRADGHSIDEIAVALTADGLALNRTGIAEVIAEHGLPRLWRRPDIVRGGPRREVLPRAELLDFSQLPDRSATTMAGLLLTIPDLLPLDKATLNTGLATGEAVNLDFHAVMHWGQDPALEKHYVPSRSQRTRSVLTFFAEDADSHTLLYANADLFKATQNKEVLTFADHWHTVTGHDPKLLIMDGKVTTQPELGKLNARGITFITLRARTPKLSAALHDLPATAWTAMTIARTGGKTRRVQVIDDPTATLSSYPGTLRQIAVAGLGHDEPTILITNDLTSPAKKIVERYARRMNIEQRLAESIRSFGLDALAGAVPLNVDLDVVLTVLAHTVCAAMRRRLPGYATTTPDILQRRFLQTSGEILNRGDEIIVRLNRRATHPCYAKPNSPPSPSPGGATDDSATSSPETRVELAA